MVPRPSLAMMLGALILPSMPLSFALSMTPVPVSVHDSEGNSVDSSSIISGSPVVLERSMRNDGTVPRDLLVLFEIRDASGVSVHIGWQSGMVDAGAEKLVGISWTAPEAGDYQVRTFVISNLTRPEVLSEVSATDIAVLPGKMSSNIIEGNNDFAVNFYSQVAQEDENRGKNIFFSPLSISTAFALLSEGARGQTADEIEGVFGLPADDSRRAQFGQLIDGLNENQGNYTLKMANALWVDEGFRLSDQYVGVARESYGSEVATVDFPTDPSRLQINQWVESKTNDKIKDLIPQGFLDDATRLVITNAIYFKGTWVKQFDPKATQEDDFMLDNGGPTNVQMMNIRDGHFKYGETDSAQLLELPYQGKISMLLILPKENAGLKGLEDSLSSDNISEWKAGLRNQSVTVQLPKFKLETKYPLKDSLQAMGVRAAFSPDYADLSGIAGERNLFVQSAIHKAFVEVNEEGTEAAGATGIGVGVTSAGPEPPVFRADHPFVFIIQDTETGNILFMGRVVNPS